MKKGLLLKTSVALYKEYDSNQNVYFKLIIGTDPETRVIITDSKLDLLLSDLPNVLATVINSHVIIETEETMEEKVS
ncbi:MAG: hypothetical protein D6748_07790 [Calditrichaeota bacterium]|nr:MAG: hypothetical protein D6748_07790 [Calditrichota bacterium]